jgi:hypothetical protein
MKLVENGTPVVIAPTQSAYAILLGNGHILGIFASKTDMTISWAIATHTGASLVGGSLVRVGGYLYWQCIGGTMINLGASSGSPLSPVYTANNPASGTFMSVWLDYAFQKLVPQGYASSGTPGVKMIQSTMDAG